MKFSLHIILHITSENNYKRGYIQTFTIKIGFYFGDNVKYFLKTSKSIPANKPNLDLPCSSISNLMDIYWAFSFQMQHLKLYSILQVIRLDYHFSSFTAKIHNVIKNKESEMSIMKILTTKK